MKFAVLAFGFGLLVASPALAEHHGPIGLFRGATPEEATTKISAGCTDRGFAVRNPNPTTAICQGGDLVRKETLFKPLSPPQDPQDYPQEYHTFSATAGPDGAVVHERTVMANGVINGKMFQMDAVFLMAMIVNARIKEFYASLGAETK